MSSVNISESLTRTKDFDIIIVGSGAAGLVAALRAASHGLKPLIIEKNSKIGGSSAYSGGSVWMPGNHVNKAAGFPDSIHNAITYLENVVGKDVSSSTYEHKLAYVTEGPKMVKWLEILGFNWVSGAGWPDYYSDAIGSSLGRTIEGQVFDVTKLGEWQDLLLIKPGTEDTPAMYGTEWRIVVIMRRTWYAYWKTVCIGFRTAWAKLRGQKPVTLGKSLVAQLMLLVKEREIPVWLDTTMISLLLEDSVIVGASVLRNGTKSEIHSKAVFLCAGGFSHNEHLRHLHSNHRLSTTYSSVPPTDTGDVLTLATSVGAKLSLMDSMFWAPSFIYPSSPPSIHFLLVERALPHSIIVDSLGQRFMNEAAEYVSFGNAMVSRHSSEVATIPSWFIFDDRYRRQYRLWMYGAGEIYERGIADEFIFCGDTIEELAQKTSIDRVGLAATISRFNVMAENGIDDSFQRGRTAYDRYFGDPTYLLNPNLGPLAEAPFYAVKVYPGDGGTKGGVLIDEHARVIREDGSSIEGLYAAGNTTASVMGRAYPGAGATLGPAMTFAYIGADHFARIRENNPN